VLGVILAGGASSRFGAPKALAKVGGRPIVERVRDALAAAAGEVVLVANAPELFAHLALPQRADAVPGAGPLGGVLTALRWARERGDEGVLCVACDMPFVPAELLRDLAERARAGDAALVVPGSRGRRGAEPLCAWYSVRLLATVERAVADGERALYPLLDRAERVPLAHVERFGDPDVLFLNVNTPADHQRAEHIAAS
jgi:molybdopterin-guanine dinucleotide biosynthesis protein A